MSVIRDRTLYICDYTEVARMKRTNRKWMTPGGLTTDRFDEVVITTLAAEVIKNHPAGARWRDEVASQFFNDGVTVQFGVLAS